MGEQGPTPEEVKQSEQFAKWIAVPGLALNRAAWWAGKKLLQKVTHKSAQEISAENLGYQFGEKLRALYESNLGAKQQQPPFQSGGGVYFGVQNLKPITKPQNADGHVLVVGGAGSGKSSCVAIPTLRDGWQAAALVVDIKGELYEKSKRPHACVFNPMDTSAMGYDPFYLLKGSDNPLPDIRDMALTLCPLEGAIKDPFWGQAAQNVLTGHLIFGFKNGGSFIQTIDVLQTVAPKELIRTEIKDSAAGRYLLQFADMDDRTLSSIMVELSNKVVAFATDPHIMAALSKAEIITPALLEQGYDVFLQLPEYKLEQWRPMMSLIVQQFARHFEKRPDTGATPVLFMLDEFPRIGKMPQIAQGLATLRSKKITIMPIIQSLAQLDAIYGSDQRKVICDNCSYKAILQATDADSQKYFSALVGTEEREKVTRNYEGSGRGFGSGGSGWLANWLDEAKGASKTTEEKPVIKPEEFAYLKDIVLLTPQGMRRVQKRPYYLNEPLVHVLPTGTQPAKAPVSPLTNTNVRAPDVQAGQSEQTTPMSPPISGNGHQTPGVPSQPGQFAPSAYAKRKQLKEQPIQELHQQFETALMMLVKSAPAGIPIEQIALTFASKLPPEKQIAFLAWWQHKQNGKGSSS